DNESRSYSLNCGVRSSSDPPSRPVSFVLTQIVGVPTDSAAGRSGPSSARRDPPSLGHVRFATCYAYESPERNAGGQPSMLRAMNLNGTAAIVSGGASGLGEATARDLTAAGCRVLVADLSESRGTELAKSLGGEFARTDVADEDSVAEAVAAAERLDA